MSDRVTANTHYLRDPTTKPMTPTPCLFRQRHGHGERPIPARPVRVVKARRCDEATQAEKQKTRPMN
jgi:hypothetical protein